MTQQTILFIDDEQWLMSGIVDSLSDIYNVLKVRTGDEGLRIIEDGKHRIDLILLDIMMPDDKTIHTLDRGRTAGVDVARILAEKGSNIPIVCYTGLRDKDVNEHLVKFGVKEIVSKRTLPSELKLVIQRVLSEVGEEY
jgi:CheY-like chemotaxis protein